MFGERTCQKAERLPEPPLKQHFLAIKTQSRLLRPIKVMIRRGSVTFGVNIQLFPLQETDFEMVPRSSDAQPASKFQEEKPKFGASSV